MNFRNKSLTVSFIISVMIILFMLAGSVLNALLMSFFILFVYYFLIYWVFDFDVSTLGFVTVLLTPAIYAQTMCLFILSVSRGSDINRLVLLGSFFVIFIILQYINRAANIINVSNFKKIPLFNVSQSFNFILSVLTLFVSMISLHILNLSPFLIVAYEAFLFFLLLFTNLIISDYPDRKSLFTYLVINEIFFICLDILLLFIDVRVVIKSVVLVIIYYLILSNFIDLQKKKKANVVFMLKNLITVLFIVFLLFGFDKLLAAIGISY